MKEIKRERIKESERIHRISFNLDDVTWAALKIKAVDERTTVQNILITLVKDYVKKR